MLIILTLLVVIATIAVILWLNRNRSQQFEASKPRIEETLNQFSAELQETKKSYISHSIAADFLTRWKDNVDFLKHIKFPKHKKLKENVSDTISLYDGFYHNAEGYNREFIHREIERCNELLENIDGKALDNQQKEAVVTNEDNMLIVAGAGAGKTLTISAKVKYLVNEMNVDPASILLITFTNKAAEEMTERINKRLGIPVEATTFHKLGLDIIAKAKGYKPDILDEMDSFLSDFFEKKIVRDKELVAKLMTFFSYYMTIPTDIDDYETLGEAYEHQKSMDFETIKGKYSDTKSMAQGVTEAVKQKLKTFAGERVKSLQEVSIANFLFLHGVRYEYERLYPYQEEIEDFRVYKPDFYLPDYDLYLEHFGIDKDGRLPWLSAVEEEKYLEGMEWKRDLHKRHETKLIETYAYYETEDRLLLELETLLVENGVEFKDADYKDVFETVYQGQADRYFAEFMKLCSTFIVLAKSAGYSPSEIDSLSGLPPKKHIAFFNRRNRIFKDIITPLYAEYEKYLKDRNAIDFADMINQATENVRTGVNITAYQYIIVDEYQDISRGRFGLLKAIKDRTGAKLFCVGDDWQSIYRFAGSDISLFTRFSEHAGYTKLLKIEKTYRNSQQLVDIMGRFIEKNPLQLKKSLCSEKELQNPIRFLEYGGQRFSLATALEKILDFYKEKQGEDSSVILLGRTRLDIEEVEKCGLFEKKKNGEDGELVFSKYPDMKIRFLTVHKSKGLEGDNIILLNFKNDLLGFPNKISDDPLLGLILSESDSYMYAEERRLLYVALTRTRNYAFILIDGEHEPSEFLHDFKQVKSGGIEINELISEDSAGISALSGSKRPVCPKCLTGTLLDRVGPDGQHFYGCSNYPQCDYTLNKKPQTRCPSCGGYLVERKNAKTGQIFWGCANYPKCRNTMDGDTL